MNKKTRLIVLTLMGILFLAADAAVGIYLLKPRPPIPGGIQSQLDFTPYLVKPATGITVDKATYRYDASQKGLAFTVYDRASDKFVVSEQSTPQQFIDIPELYNKVVDKFNRYGVFDNAIGTVYLTRPDGQSGQTAIMNSHGVLMFVRSSKDLGDDQWRRLFNSFELEKT